MRTESPRLLAVVKLNRRIQRKGFWGNDAFSFTCWCPGPMAGYPVSWAYGLSGIWMFTKLFEIINLKIHGRSKWEK